MATGLALGSSDLDIAIRGANITSKEKLVSYISKLCEELQKQKYVKECKSIVTASVPLIKMVLLYDIALI